MKRTRTIKSFFTPAPTPIIQPASQTQPSAQAQLEVVEEAQVVEEPETAEEPPSNQVCCFHILLSFLSSDQLYLWTALLIFLNTKCMCRFRSI
jgi:hypothetical protein